MNPWPLGRVSQVACVLLLNSSNIGPFSGFHPVSAQRCRSPHACNPQKHPKTGTSAFRLVLSELLLSPAQLPLEVDNVEAGTGVDSISCSASACKCSANSIAVAGKGVVSRASNLPPAHACHPESHLCSSKFGQHVRPFCQQSHKQQGIRKLNSQFRGTSPRFLRQVLSVVRMSLVPACAGSRLSLSSRRSRVLS